MICKKCNASIPDDVLFCPKCNKWVERERSVPTGSQFFSSAGDLVGGSMPGLRKTDGDAVPGTVGRGPGDDTFADYSEEDYKPVVFKSFGDEAADSGWVERDSGSGSTDSWGGTGMGTSCRHLNAKPWDKFCPDCGAPLLGDDSGSTVGVRISTGTTALERVRAICLGKQFMVAAVAFTASILFFIISSACASANWVSMMKTVMRQSGMYGVDGMDEIMLVLNAAQRGSLISAIISALPSILICTGLWLIYVSAADRSGSGMQTTGLSMIKGVTIFNLVTTDLVLALIEIAIIIAAIAGGRYDDSFGWFAIVMFFVVLGVGTLINLYYGKAIQTVNTMKGVITSGRPSVNVSGFVSCMCYILGGVTAVGSLIILLVINFWAFLSCAGMATAMICFGMLIGRFRDEMQRAR